ncbi:MAG: MarR family transcriptional regulator [Thaumarchaeota archaeon]|nr:MarR family transcriptional regulator [Nitrososphaerota archaeon]
MTLQDKLDLQSSIGFAIKSTEKSLERVLDLELRARCGLTGGQWKVILVLALSDGLAQKKLAEMIFVESPTLVPIIDKMEKDGLVLRKSDSEDRRTNRIFLTSKSKKLVDSITECLLGFRKSITLGISERDLGVARQVLQAISQNTERIAKDKHDLVLKNPHSEFYKKK